MNSETETHERLTQQEFVLTHLQNELEQMHSVILDQQKEILELHNRIARLEGRIEEQLNAEPPTNLEDERPPHY